VGKGRFWASVSLFESSLSAAEWAWRIATVLLIGGSGTLGSLIARADPFFKQLGPSYWLGVGVATALAAAIVLFLVKAAALKQAETELNVALSSPKSFINPLATSFQDTIVRLEDMRLPTVQLHENKHFKRCKLVGPAAVAILGGTYVNSGFLDCGDVVALPDNVSLTGIIVLKNCTVEECEFIRVSIFTDKNTAKGFATIQGASVKGLT
jgi:hypothetical protein